MRPAIGLALWAVVCLAAADGPAEPLSNKSAERGVSTAPVKMLLFSDFQCPFCADLAPAVNEVANAFPGQVQLFFKHFPLAFHTSSPLAHEAALAAGDQGKFWEMHDRLFQSKGRLSLQDLQANAAAIGLDLSRFNAALESHRFRPEVEHDLAEGRALGISGTPRLYINGKVFAGAKSADELKNAVREALGLPTESSLAAFQALLLGDAPVRGSPSAKVNIVAFSDFQCPFCSRIVPVLNEVLSKYPDDIKLQFRHFPLSIHPAAPLAHEAALAAAAQGKFWEMHDRLFAQQVLDRASLSRYARELGLDVALFDKALLDRTYRKRVEEDVALGAKMGVSGTPSVFVNGKQLVGFHSVADFNRLIEAELGGFAPTPAPLPVTMTPPQVKDSFAPYVTKGNPTAPVTIQWFTDVQSGPSVEAARVIDTLLAEYPNQLRVALRHRPLESHREAALAHEALAAAGKQGKFWAFHDLLLANQHSLGINDLLAYARQAGLDVDRLSDALKDRRFKPMIDADLADARRSDIRGTPTILINGKRIDGIQPLSFYREILAEELKQK